MTVQSTAAPASDLALRIARQVDKNNDREISAAESRMSADTFKRIDTNGNGSVGMTELQDAVAGVDAERRQAFGAMLKTRENAQVSGKRAEKSGLVFFGALISFAATYAYGRFSPVVAMGVALLAALGAFVGFVVRTAIDGKNDQSGARGKDLLPQRLNELFKA